MARTNLTPQVIDADGLQPVYSAANVDGHAAPPGTILHFKNTNAAVRNVTLVTPITVGGRAVADDVVQIPATTGDVLIALGSREIFAQPATGLVDINFDAVAGLTVACLQH